MQRAAWWRRTIAAVVVAGTAASACANDAPIGGAPTVPPAPSSAGTAPVSTPASTLELTDSALAVPTSVTALGPTTGSFTPSEVTPGAGDDVGRVHLVGCAWEWFGRYRLDLEWEPPADGAGGSWATTVAGYNGDVGMFGVNGLLELGGAAGPVSVTVEAPLYRADIPGSIEVARSDRTDIGAGLRCDVMIENRSIGDYPEITFEPSPPADPTWPRGSAQQLATGLADAPLLPLASLFEQLPVAPFDRLYVAPDRRLDGVSVTRDGTCLTVTQSYDSGGGVAASSVQVVQSRGCPAPSAVVIPGPFVTIPVADAEWFVTVTGDAEAAGAVAAELQRVEVAGATPVTGPPTPAIEDWFTAHYIEHRELTELTRFLWRAGAVGIVDDSSVGELERFAMPVVYLPLTPSTSGVLVSICDEQTVGVYREGAGGFAWAVTRDSQRVPTVPLEGGGRAPIPLVPIAGTVLFVGFLDLDLLAWDSTASMDPVDQLGAQLPCTQS